MIFHFPHIDTLRLALTGGLVPPTVSVASAVAEFTPEGGIWVEPGVTGPRDLAATLKKFGVEAVRSREMANGVEVCCWPQLLPVSRDPQPLQISQQAPVLLEISDPAMLPILSGEMLRLGNDRQSYRWLAGADESHDHVLLRVIGPPYYSLLRALEAGPNERHPLRAYLERSPRVWIEAGYTHPLVEQIRPAEGQILLVRAPRDWTFYDDVPFRDIYEILDFQLPEDRVDHADGGPADKISVPLRLTAGSSHDTPELWVLTHRAVAKVDQLVRELNERQIARLSFAVGANADEEPVIVIRVRPSRQPVPQLAIDGLACKPFLKLPNLFVPCGTRLQPPLRRDAIRQLLADDPAQITWLVPEEDGRFQPEALPDSAFRPLADWVDYVLDRDRAVLTGWVASAQFDFDAFICKDDTQEKPEKPKSSGRRRPGSAGSESTPGPGDGGGRQATVETESLPEDRPRKAIAALTPVELSATQQRLSELEAQFMAFKGPLDAPDRQTMWPEMASLHADLGHRDDALLGWANALWWKEQVPSEAADAWMRVAFDVPIDAVTDTEVLTLVERQTPSPIETQRVATYFIHAAAHGKASATVRGMLPQVQQFLDRHDGQISVRTAWLAAVALARLSGGDPLGLARSRERLLARLHAGGLSAERDLPSFLRMAGHRDNARLRLVRDHIGQLHQRARSWAAEVGQNTLAYLDLTFAFGLARLGETSLARELMNHAGERLQALDRSIKNEAERGVGPLLFDSFAYRIEQVLAGDSVSSPLPREYHELQAQLPSLTGYAVARYWSNTSILEPQAKADPYSKTLAQGEFAKEIAALPGYRDARILVDRVNRLLRMGASGKSKPVDRIPVLNESLPLAPRAGEAFTLSLLDQVIPAIDAVAQESHPNLNEKMYQLLERAIIQAGHFGRTGQVQQFVSFFVKLIKTSDRLPLPYIGRLAGQSLRSLRRLGLLSELQTLLTVLEAAVLGGKSLASVKQLTGPAWTHSVQILLYLAGAWLQGDTPEKATPILDEGRRYLFRDERGASPERPLPIDYMKVAVAYATALGQTDPLFSLPRFDEFFGRLDKIPNSMTSSKHYSLLHLNLVEAVVLAVASDELAIGPEARRWLDEDEYLVRRRIHADMDAARSGAGW